MSGRRGSWVLVPLLAVLLTVGAAIPCDAGTKVRFAFGTPTIQILALNIAIGKYLGYYEEEGIDIDILAAGSNTAIVQGIATGTFDVGVYVPATVLPLIAKGAAPPFTAFYNYTPKFKYDFVSKPGSGIKGVEDLRGKTLGIPRLGHSADPVLRALLRQYNLDPEKDVRIVVAGEGPTAGDMVTRGRVDAYFAGDTDIGQIESLRFKLERMEFKATGELAGIGAFLIGARESFLQSNARECIGLGRAVAKGTVFALANLRAASEIFLKIYPTAVAKGKSHDEAVTDMLYIIGPRARNWVREEGAPKKWGVMLEEDFKNERKFLKLEDKLPDLSKTYTNRFIEEINAFDAEKIRQQAHNYKLQ